jgi:hypothetical protein
LAHALCKQEKFAQAEKEAYRNLQKRRIFVRPATVQRYILFSLRYLYLALLDKGKPKIAESLLRGALRLSIDIHKKDHFNTVIALGHLQENLERQGKMDEASRVSQMSISELRESYLAEDNWDEERAKAWASKEGEEVSKYYPYVHTMYCGCSLSNTGGSTASRREICNAIRHWVFAESAIQ